MWDEVIDKNKLYTMKEVEKLTCYRREELRYGIRRKRLPAHKKDNKVYIRGSDLIPWLTVKSQEQWDAD